MAARGKLDIINQALVLLGDDPVISLETDDGAGATAARLLYEDAVRDVFTDNFKFRFSVKQFKLNQLQEIPIDAGDGGYKYAYELPSNYLTLVKLNTNHDFDIYGGELRCNDDKLILDYVARVDESMWPPYFVTMVIHKLAALFAMPVTDSESSAAKWEQMYEMKKRSARAVDSKATPNRPFSQSPFLNARLSGSRRAR